jgi:hypothetical protein
MAKAFRTTGIATARPNAFHEENHYEKGLDRDAQTDRHRGDIPVIAKSEEEKHR